MAAMIKQAKLRQMFEELSEICEGRLAYHQIADLICLRGILAEPRLNNEACLQATKR